MAITENKNKVSSLAKDFGMQSKDIIAILKDYTEAPKGHSQVLSDRELSIVFDYLTLHHQVKIETIFAETYTESSTTSTCVGSGNFNTKPGKSYRLEYSATFSYSDGRSETITGSTSR